MELLVQDNLIRRFLRLHLFAMFSNFHFIISAFKLIGSFRGSNWTRPHNFGSQKGRQYVKKSMKKRFFDFKQKKETKKEAINASQLAIRNFNDVTKNDWIHPPFYFYVVFLKNQNISITYFLKRNSSSCL